MYDIENLTNQIKRELIQKAYWTKFVFFRLGQGLYIDPRDKGFYVTEKGRPYFNTGTADHSIEMLIQQAMDNFAFQFWQSLDYPIILSLDDRRKLLFEFDKMTDSAGLPLRQQPKYVVCAIQNTSKDVYEVRSFFEKLKCRPEYDPIDAVFEQLIPLYVYHEYFHRYPMYMLLPEKIYPEVHIFGEFSPKFYMQRNGLYCHFNCELKIL